MAELVKIDEHKKISKELSESRSRLTRTVFIVTAATFLGFLSLCFFVTRRLADFYFSLMVAKE